MAQCVRVVATPQTGVEGISQPIARKDEVKVAIYRAADWSEQVTLIARGYSDCAAAESQFVETSEPATRTFPTGEPQTVALLIRKKAVVGTDADGDGRFAGPDDCDDSDARRFVGNTEACHSAVDNNCSETTGCNDPLCTGACAPNGQGVCQGTLCFGPESVLCSDGLDNDGDALIDCFDPDCLALACNDGTACTSADTCQSDGGCTGQAIAVSCETAPGVCFTAPGTCDPADGGCVFPTRTIGTPCNDNNACTGATTCQQGGVCAGGAATVTCNSPPAFASCYGVPGTCLPQDGGCVYDKKPSGAACDDGRACFDNDVCDGDGGCAGVPQLCSPPVCRTGGTCNEPGGSCTFQNATPGILCDDTDVCTLGTTCNGAGQCAGGTSVPCTPPDACQVPTGCDPATGCQFGPTCVANECQQNASCTAGTCSFTPKTDGTVCSIGTCQGGACVPPFVPFDSTTPASNFNADAGVPKVAQLTINCDTTFSTGNGTTPATLTLCDGGTLTSGSNKEIEIVNQTGGPEVALLRVAGLTVAAGKALTVVGARPLILAVYGDATIDGTVDASGMGGTAGPGSNQNCSAATPGVRAGSDPGPGGGGGAYSQAGGNGGTTTGIQGMGGASSGNPAISPLRGGCDGANGGGGDPNTVLGGRGGGGGGALQITASRNLRLNGTLRVSGGGGRGGQSAGSNGGGGGGGGSGGAIVLEAKSLRVSATARAYVNGGSGGEGGDNGSTTGSNGNDGMNGYGRTAAGANLTGGGSGGQGGGGSDATSIATGGQNATGNNGGGGGGGSAGRIRINFGTICRENGYEFSPSTNANNGGTNAGFTSNPALPASVASCP